MPTITIMMNPISDEKKKLLVKSLTTEAARITELSPEFFFVYVQEHANENIGVGGKTLKEMLG